MSYITLFIGTSFLGAVKQGYDSLFPTSGSATFVGLNAPELAANLESGWSIHDGCLKFSSGFSCFISGYEKYIGRDSGTKTFPGTAKVAGLGIDLRSYKNIVFVDMFYRLRPMFIVSEKFFPSIDGIPVSEGLLAEIRANGYNGWISLNQHPQYGNVPFVNTNKLLAAIKKYASSASVFLLSSPRPLIGNVDIRSKYGDYESARRSFHYLEKFYENELAQYGIQYLAQPPEVLDDEECLTRAEYSRGVHLKNASVSDEHMNLQYGEAILNKYYELFFLSK